MLEGYYIVENTGVVPAERRFKFKDLKAWGYDLHLGTIDGKEAYFVSETGTREEGETYTEGGKEYHITETQKALPKNSKLLARIIIERGQPYLEFWLETEEGTYPLAKEDPRLVLHRFWTEKKFKQLDKYVVSVGLTTDFYKSKILDASVPLPYEEYPPKVRRVLREVRDFHRDLTDFGRFIFQYFGEVKKESSYRLWWLLPTIHLFDVEVSNEADKILAMLD
ncbi:TIGR00703 family protein [Thermococcus profundus]|uniref:UPF0128 protein A3L09_08620 n=1 Tax=Thermococcus profundus TaxID=49899 RepID=A0A2Z2MF59_THEPR|nr:TIGR00703 family protein [Thermococcus profundus]ASJ03315.1 TIGR00703 family protein [Thermococcus profundus]